MVDDGWFRRLAQAVSRAVGTSLTFLVALAIVFVWAVTGPLFHFSNTWQLVINTGTTIVTFLMVFVIQNTQNREMRAVHLKLDELIHALKSARDSLVRLEEGSDRDMERLEEEFRRVHDESQASCDPDPLDDARR